MLRLAAPRGERLEHAGRLDVHVAGAEANVAAALAQCGVPTRWISRLPDSPLGRRVERDLARAGVITDAVSWDPHGRLGTFFSDTGVPPRPTRVLYDRADSSFAGMATLPAGALEGARIAHVTGITPALGPRSAALAGEFADAAHAQGAIVSVDLNHRARLWSAKDARHGLRDLLAHADVVVCRRDDARAVLDLTGEPGDVLEKLRAKFAPRASALVLTLGAEGCAALDGQNRTLAEPARQTTVIDRFGMGDAFVAGLLWGLLRDDLALALRAGVTLAALKATMAGDLIRLDPGELEEALGGPQGDMTR